MGGGERACACTAKKQNPQSNLKWAPHKFHVRHRELLGPNDIYVFSNENVHRMKNKANNITGTVPKTNRKIVERGAK